MNMPKPTIQTARDMQDRFGRDKAVALVREYLLNAITGDQEILARYWRQVMVDMCAKESEFRESST